MSVQGNVSGEKVLDETPVMSAAEAIDVALLVDQPYTEIVFVRHGQQDLSQARGRPGQTDPPLTAKGREQAAAAGRYLSREPVSRIYCSGLLRAQETAGILADAVRVEHLPVVVPELREIQLFRCLPKGRPLVEILGRDGLERATSEFVRTRNFTAFPGTEPSAELRARAHDQLTRLVREHEGQRVVVVTHGGFVNGFLAQVFGIAQDMFFLPAHGSVTRVLFGDGRWALSSANEVAHLREGAASLITF